MKSPNKQKAKPRDTTELMSPSDLGSAPCVLQPLEAWLCVMVLLCPQSLPAGNTVASFPSLYALYHHLSLGCWEMLLCAALHSPVCHPLMASPLKLLSSQPMSFRSFTLLTLGRWICGAWLPPGVKRQQHFYGKCLVSQSLMSN